MFLIDYLFRCRSIAERGSCIGRAESAVIYGVCGHAGSEGQGVKIVK